jgi:hypothetical protein
MLLYVIMDNTLNYFRLLLIIIGYIYPRLFWAMLAYFTLKRDNLK